MQYSSRALMLAPWQILALAYRTGASQTIHEYKAIFYDYCHVGGVRLGKHGISVLFFVPSGVTPPARPVFVLLYQNNLHELWALLNFLLPSVFKDSEAFSKVFDLNVDDADKKQNMIKQLHKILRCGHRLQHKALSTHVASSISTFDVFVVRCWTKWRFHGNLITAIG